VILIVSEQNSKIKIKSMSKGRTMRVFRFIEKVCSLSIAVAYVIAMVFAHWTARQVALCLFAMLLPLACIWFPEELGGYTGIYMGRGQTLDTETPAPLVSIMGWILLVGLPAFVYFWVLR
jgi:hypothetical protein